MPYYKVPMAIDAIRLTGASVADTTANIIAYLQAGAGGWNHERAARFFKLAFKGVAEPSRLISACRGDGRPAFVDNAKILEACLPAVAGRSARVFSFPRTKFSLTPSIHSSIGPAFFIVENERVKLVYIHARNENRASISDLAAFALLVKREILDSDFYGLDSDIEIYAVNKRGSNRTSDIYDVHGLAGLAPEPLDSTLSRFAEAFALVDANRLAGPLKPRRSKLQTPDGRQQAFSF